MHDFPYCLNTGIHNVSKHKRLRGSKNTQNYTKKDDWDNHDDGVIYLEPDILECKVKWALGSITMSKPSGGDGIPAALLQILKDDAIKSAALNKSTNLENSAVATGLQKVSFHSNPKEGKSQRMFKLPHNCTHFAC